MKKPSLPTLIAAIVGAILLIAVLIFTARLIGGELDRKRQSTAGAPAQGGTTQSSKGEDITHSQVNAPYMLRQVVLGQEGDTYVTFEICASSDTDNVAYVCGRLYAAERVQSIAWAQEGYDVVVTLTDGGRQVFGFDGYTWQ